MTGPFVVPAPYIRGYPNGTPVQPTDAFVINRAGVGTMYVTGLSGTPPLTPGTFTDTTIVVDDTGQIIQITTGPGGLSPIAFQVGLTADVDMTSGNSPGEINIPFNTNTGSASGGNPVCFDPDGVVNFNYLLPVPAAPLEPATVTATISGSLLDVTATSGIAGVGMTVTGAGVPPGVTIISIASGSGGIGTYNLSQVVTISTPETMVLAFYGSVFVAPVTGIYYLYAHAYIRTEISYDIAPGPSIAMFFQQYNADGTFVSNVEADTYVPNPATDSSRQFSASIDGQFAMTEGDFVFVVADDVTPYPAGVGTGLTILAYGTLFGGFGPTTGAGIPPPPPPYLIDAVAVDSSTYLSINSLTAAASTQALSFSVWLYFQDGQFNNRTIFVTDPAATYTNTLYSSTSSPNIMECDLWDVTGTTDTLEVTDGASSHTDWTGVWVNFMGSFDTSEADPNKRAKFLVNGIDFTDKLSIGYPAFDMVFDALPFFLFSDTGLFSVNFEGYAAEIWIAPGQSLLDGHGNIPASTIGKFINGLGKPVSLGANGQIPTGAPPAIYLSLAVGNPASDFATNLGTGGDFTITGALTTAPSSPSD